MTIITFLQTAETTGKPADGGVNVRLTCQHMCGDFLSKMYWVSGDGSSSYLSKGSLSITMGSQSTQEKRTTGCAERGGWWQETEIIEDLLDGFCIHGKQTHCVFLKKISRTRLYPSANQSCCSLHPCMSNSLHLVQYLCSAIIIISI